MEQTIEELQKELLELGEDLKNKINAFESSFGLPIWDVIIKRDPEDNTVEQVGLPIFSPQVYE